MEQFPDEQRPNQQYRDQQYPNEQYQDKLEEIEHRISQLELNQHRLNIMTCDAPEGHKAFDRACFTHNLTFEEEYASKKAIIDFLNSTRDDIQELLNDVSMAVGNRHVAASLITAFKQRGTGLERWKQIDPEDHF